MCLFEILKTTRTQLQDKLARTLVDGRRHDSPDALTDALRRAYDEASVVFATVRGHAAPIEVLPHRARGTVIITASSGQIALRRSPRGGWESVHLELHGEHLARYLSEWPTFQLPTDPGANVNGALAELRHLFAAQEEVDVERVAEIAEAHISPLVHDYIQRHRATWSADVCWAFEQRQRRRFAQLGIELFEAQTRGELRVVIENAAARPAELADALNHVLDPTSRRWSNILGFPIEVVATAISDGTVVIGTPWEYDTVVFERGREGWRPCWGVPSVDAALDAIVELLQTDTSLEDWERREDDGYDSGDYPYDESEEDEIENRNRQNYWHFRDPTVLHERSDDELLEEEEHWRVQVYFDGLARGQQDSADRF